ncbi:unnamed protein product, partial [marine sediment metagenome]
MIQKFGLIIKKIIPEFILYKLLNTLLKPRIKKAKRAFKQALSTPVYLDQNKLKSLQQKYSYPPNHGYDPQTLEKRGKERAKGILNLIHKRKEEINTFLE